MTTYTFTLLVDHVHDGDTVYGTLVADAGLGVQVRFGATGPLWGVRLAAINAPELGTPDGNTCAALLAGVVKKGAALRVDSIGWDKYGKRIDGILYGPDGADLSAWMLANGPGVKAVTW